jgi:malate dehydrogenase
VVDSVRSAVESTATGDCCSIAVCSDGSYGIEPGLICSFPIKSHGGKLAIVQGVPVNAFSQAKIDSTVNELKEEKTMVSELLPK